ncbi:hypothetical protein NDU88_006638 [Pleurodeles waltl]|uniref:Uncharacterized protein n=1 Tax=Pleurodeles waltl TaxID=8319 RepID=A0AAV7WFD5_PLEWA|nr:hypothetical protein NDU88_006638 [Pleurodeles waltl]
MQTRIDFSVVPTLRCGSGVEPAATNQKEDDEPDEHIAIVEIDVGNVTEGRISHEEWVKEIQNDDVLQ